MAQRQRKIKNTKKLLLLTLALFLPVLIFIEFVALFTPFVSGFAAYPLKTAQCGHLPYIADSFMASYTYTKPGDGYYRGPDALTSPKDYYCTESEVQRAGYQPNVWGEEQCRLTRQGKDMLCRVANDGFSIIARIITIFVIVAGLLSYVIAWVITKKKPKHG